MINVLHLRDTDRICGPGKTILETARAATPGEFHHVIGLLMLARETSNAYYDAAVERGVTVAPIRSAHQLDPRVLRAISRAIDEHDIHLVHSHEYKSDILTWALSRFRRIPIMTTVHGWITNSAKSRLYVRASQKILPQFDRVIAVSGETRAKVLASGVPPEKVIVIHNGIVAENYDPAAHRPGVLRERYGIPPGARIIGCIGRLSPEKGQRDLLQAAPAVIARHPETWFVFAGDGPDRALLEQQAADAGVGRQVVFTGHLTDVRPVFRDIELLALTSHTEGFPNVVLESLCMNTPVLATDVGGTREIVEDGVTGVLLPAQRVDRITDGLLRMLADPGWTRTLAETGRRAVDERFTFGRRVAQEEAVCREILENRRH